MRPLRRPPTGPCYATRAMRITETDALTLAQRIRTKQLSPVAVVDAVLERIDALQPTVNAFITVTADEARDAARRAEAAVMAGSRLGPLHGVPFSVKDLLFARGARTTMGSFSGARVRARTLPIPVDEVDSP